MDMNTPGRKYRPLTNEEVDSIRNLVANGDITPSAPALQSSPWSTEKRQQLNDAINTMRHHQKEGY
ncbi:hypothetical protein JRK10_003689 [Salmonella enterica]|nr:hypothetical protein [Salmonella enterica]EHD2124141.1 hypothetical protein [Salmonella enterica]